MSAREEGTAREPGHEPDEEYLAQRERLGWLSVKVVAGTIVVVLVCLWVLLALLPERR